MAQAPSGIGNRIAPARFVAFVLILAVAVPIGWALLGWREGVLAGFDIAAIVFLAACLPLLNDKPDRMRELAAANDANRAVLLGITLAVSLVVLVAVAAELSQKGAPKPFAVVMIVATLLLAWLFSNSVFALHYAHMFYSSGNDDQDCGGVEFPKTDEPDYQDFLYFAFCLGMTFQTSDVDITDRRFRQVVTFQCFAAFIFNLGVLAFSINVLGGGGS